ncbi:hypothetical protein GIB67_002281 [Kingdonia uniflora]|uniref:Uncharacterized protein n=1 Tax=Kingdonia uniflora TaxID=39325 RepID=A0A7J7KWY4_9MAGN|nr:hypothetical protein GIB67_002281 [Kingdonia uniflora]
MASTSGCAKADEVDLVGHLSPVIGVGDDEDTVAELVEWPHLKGSRVEYPTGSSRFREFCKAKSSIDGIWGHTFGYRGNFFRTYSVSQGGDYLYLLPNLAKGKKYRHLGGEVSLEYVQGVVKDSRTVGFCCYLAQFDYGLILPLSNLAKSVMNMIGACPTQLNCNFWDVILVCETLNERWAASGSERRITAKDFLEYYVVKYVTATDGGYLSSSSSRPCFFDLSSAGRVWNDNLLWVSGINCKVSRMESFIDAVAREGTELEVVLKELEISRFKRVASKDDKVRRSQAKRRMAGKTPGSMEEKLLTLELNTPLKLARLNEMPDGPVDRATVSSTVVVQEESDKIAEEADLRPRFEVEAGLLEEQCRAKAREKMVAVMDDEFMKYEDRLDDNVKLSLKLEEAKRQVEDKTAAILSRDVALNQLTSELAELKEKAASGSRHEAELAEYRIRALNDEISDMKCKIRTLNEQLLKKEIDLDTARTGFAVSEADLEKMNNSIAGKDLKLRNSAQIRDSLIARLDHLKDDLRCLKGREAQSRADLAEIQAKNKSLVDNLAHARGNVRRVVQRDKEMNERINQLCA